MMTIHTNNTPINHSFSSRKNGPKYSQGFSIIEVMIALLILGGGLIGYAYMQTLSLQQSQESYHRSQVMVLINELVEGMRALQVNSQNGNFSLYTASNALFTNCEPAFSATSGGTDPAADTHEMIKHDLTCFYTKVNQLLPFGTAQISQNASNAAITDITVYWSSRTTSESQQVAIDCGAAANRIMSSDTSLPWPLESAPSVDICMTSHTWSVQI